jgi:hypothetical protein
MTTFLNSPTFLAIAVLLYAGFVCSTWVEYVLAIRQRPEDLPPITGRERERLLRELRARVRFGGALAAVLGGACWPCSAFLYL